jgi:hypothetical protein
MKNKITLPFRSARVGMCVCFVSVLTSEYVLYLLSSTLQRLMFLTSRKHVVYNVEGCVHLDARMSVLSILIRLVMMCMHTCRSWTLCSVSNGSQARSRGGGKLYKMSRVSLCVYVYVCVCMYVWPFLGLYVIWTFLFVFVCGFRVCGLRYMREQMNKIIINE